MVEPTTGEELREHVRRQLSFIEWSCQGFDDGRHEEAIRIAGCARVLLHDQPNKPDFRSLLAQLGLQGSLRLTSTNPPDPFATMVLPGEDSPLVLRPSEGDSLVAWGSSGPMAPLTHSRQRAVPIVQWLEEAVALRSGQSVTRYFLILKASNKDGHAHVDIENVPAMYERMRHAATWTTGDASGSFPGMHLFTLRQIGFELLNSPELIALASA